MTSFNRFSATEKLSGTGDWSLKEGTFSPSLNSVFIIGRCHALFLELKEELEGFTAEERKTLEERLDILSSIMSISTVNVSRSWLGKWPRKVISMPEDRLDEVRKAISWLTDAYRWYPSEIYSEDSKAMLEVITPYILKSLEAGSLNPLQNQVNIEDRDKVFPKLLMGPEEAKAHCEKYRKIIFGRFDSLQALWRARASDIQEKWKKMSITQRETVLDKWSNINHFHGKAWLSVIQDCGKKRFEVEGVQREVQDRAFKRPIINKQDLKVGDSLLSFLETRATQEPYLFIHHDAITIEMFTKKKLIELPCLYGYRMYFPRKEDRKLYGMLFNDPSVRTTSEEMWAKEKSEKEKKGEPSETLYYEAIYVLGISAQYGLPAMEIQLEIYGFLLTMCNAILQAPIEEDSKYELPEEDELHPLVR